MGEHVKAAITHKAIREEFDRLMRIEIEKDPLKARFISKGYYVELISQNSSFSISDKGHITKIINGWYERNRHKKNIKRKRSAQ